MIQTGLDRLLERGECLNGRSYGLATHAAAVSAELLPAHLALRRAGAHRPQRLFGPEHGLYAVEQDMVAAAGGTDPWSGAPVVSLYGDAESTLRPDVSLFSDLDLLIVDFQDVGSRYYTYAATAVWAAAAALGAGCEVWVLDRPNPLNGEEVEGNLPRPGYESFVGAFPTPVRHGLTLGELTAMMTAAAGVDAAGLRVWEMVGWRREMDWPDTERPWIAPSPNMPAPATAEIYPGACLLEATTVSEGRGTTQPFELFGSPTLDSLRLADDLNERELPGCRFVPTFFKPQFQKHAGLTCGGARWIVDDIAQLRPYRTGVEIIAALHRQDPEFGWRREPYEFVADRPAIDLLTGDDVLRRALDGEAAELETWLDSWAKDEATFRAERAPYLLYPTAEGG